MGWKQIKAKVDAITARFSRSRRADSTAFKDLLNLVELLTNKLEEANLRIEFLEGELEGKKRGKSSSNTGRRESSKHGKNSRSKPSDHSSEKHRKGMEADDSAKGTARKPGPGRNSKADLEIHNIQLCTIDPSLLPADARYKGTRTTVIRDMRIVQWNTQFELEVYYSASEGKSYVAPLPEGYDKGEFGPGLKGAIVTMKYDAGTSETGIERFLNGYGVPISAGSISNILLKMGENFGDERTEIVGAGFRSTVYGQSDDTSAKVKGKSWHTHVLCNEYYTAYFTREGKDRMTLIDVFLGRDAANRSYRYSELTDEFLCLLGVSKRQAGRLDAAAKKGKDYDQKGMDALLGELFIEDGKNGSAKKTIGGLIAEAMALTYYHEQEDVIIPEVLISDDAPQYQLLALDHMLCWIHDGRHYEKLSPLVGRHRLELEKFQKKYWSYYKELAKYRVAPGKKAARRLEKKFGRLFRTKTGYQELDERIAKTLAKKERLLVVLRRPEVPLHNNASELGARRAARRRDISLHSRSLKGVESMDTLTTIVETCRKLKVGAGNYIRNSLEGLLSDGEKLPALIRKASAANA